MRRPEKQSRKGEESGRSSIILGLKITARINHSVKHLLTGAGLVRRERVGRDLNN